MPARPPPSPQRINALQDRHHVELSRFDEEYSQARSRLKANLESQYGAHERVLRYETDQLQSPLDHSGQMRLWWLKLTRQISQNAEAELLNNRRTLENIELRRREIALRQQTERQTFLPDSQRDQRQRRRPREAAL